MTEALSLLAVVVLLLVWIASAVIDALLRDAEADRLAETALDLRRLREMRDEIDAGL